MLSYITGDRPLIAESEYPLFGRACLRLRSFCAGGQAIAYCTGGRRIVGPAIVECRQCQVDLAPFRMSLGLQRGKVLAERSREPDEVLGRCLYLVIVGDEKCSYRDGGEVLRQQIWIARCPYRRRGVDP